MNYILVKPEKTQHQITDLDAGRYSTVQFFVGIDDKENDQSEDDFTSRASGDPLAMDNPSMHWGWNGGYKYIRIDGMTDTDGDGTPETPLAFHLGNFEMFELITNFQFPIQNDFEGGSNSLEFEVDLAKLFTEIDLSTQTDTHVFNNVDLAKAFHANLSNAIISLN